MNENKMDNDWRTLVKLYDEARASNAALVLVLGQCEEYFDQRADAEYFPDSPRPHANEEMSLLTEIRTLLEREKP